MSEGSFGATKRGKQPNNNKRAKVVQLRNYEVLRILCVDCALHVSAVLFCENVSPRLCSLAIAQTICSVFAAPQAGWKWENKSGED